METYNRQAATFHSQRDRSLFEREWLDRFLDLLPENGTVLDIGCGSGDPLAKALIDRGFKVTGMDFSSSMLALARKNLPNAVWYEQDMRKLNLSGPFDGLLAFNSLFHLTPDEQRAAIPDILELGGEKAAFLTTTGHCDGETTGTVGEETVYHGSLAPCEYASILSRSGYSVIDHRTDPACNDHTLLLATRSRLEPR